MNYDWDEDFEIKMEHFCNFWEDQRKQSEKIMDDIIEKIEEIPDEQFICMKTRFCKMINDVVSELSDDAYEDVMSDKDLNHDWNKLTRMTAKTVKKNLKGHSFENWTRSDFNQIIREKLFKSRHCIPLETLWVLQDNFQQLYKKTLPKEVSDLSVERTSKQEITHKI